MNKILLSTILILSSLMASAASAATVTYYATATDSNIKLGTISPLKLTQDFSINYAIPSNWNVTSFTISLKLADDACTSASCPDGLFGGRDPRELAGIIKLESSILLNAVEVAADGWYGFNIANLASYLLPPHTSPLTGTVAALPGFDFIYKNAKVTLEYSHVPIPPAVWLFGSGLAGLLLLTRNKKSFLA
ncbi:MAG: hypothetical protein ACXWTS_08085 [Methylococcaceae bacterium]